jgi:cysteinyl-tRNA synthetase
MTQTIELVAGPAEGQNLFGWANQALSVSRARAFANALVEINNNKFSAQWSEASEVVNTIERDARIARADEIKAIETATRQKQAEIEAQIEALRSEQAATREAGDAAVDAIRSEINKTPALVEARETLSALWRRDDQAVEPLRQALVAKYIAAQAKANA